MQGWAEGLLKALEQAQGEQAVFEKIAAAAHAIGFERCAYGLRIPLPLTKPQIIMINNYSPAWQARYEEAGYLARDPTVLHGSRSRAPLVWSDAVFAQAQDLWADAQSHGLRVGWAQSSCDAQGVVGLLTLARSSEPLTDAELSAKETRMRWLVNIAHVALTRALVPKLYGALETPLTFCEKQVLKWAADGKTSGEISDILKIGVDTVQFHTRNAIAKLGAANKTAAVARAAVLGLLG